MTQSCDRCKAAVKAEAGFCWNCGRSLAGAAPSHEGEAVAVREPPPAEQVVEVEADALGDVAEVQAEPDHTNEPGQTGTNAAGARVAPAAVSPQPAHQQYGPTPEQRNMAMTAHLLALLTGWLGPLIFYLVRKDASPYERLHAKQAMAWAVTIHVAAFVAGLLIFAFFIGCALLPAVAIVAIAYPIRGMICANRGEMFLYPWAARTFCKDEIIAVYGRLP